MPGSGPLPHSATAELAALAAPLAAPEEERAEHVATLVKGAHPASFFLKHHRLIFRAVRRLHVRGEAVDVITLSDELESADDLDDAGGAPYLARLVDHVPSAAHLPAYLDRLRVWRLRRELFVTGEQATEGSWERDPRELLGETRERLEAVERLASEGEEDGLRTAREILDDPDARRTAVTVADRLAWAGHVTMIAAREKSGKSTLLRWAAARCSQGEPVWGGPPVGDGAGVDVLYYGQEAPVDVAADLDRFGANLDRIYVRDLRLHAGDRLALVEREVERLRPALVIVDTLSTLVALMDLDPGSSTDWELVMDRLGALASRTGTALVFAHHARKADGSYRDSTSIGAGVDCILEMRSAPAEGENVRTVTAKPRSAIPASSFTYELTGEGRYQRLQRLGASLSLEERVQRFVAAHDGCSQRDVLDGVRGRTERVREALATLSENGGPLACDDSETPYRYSIPQKARGNGTETLGNGPGNAGTDSGGRSVSRGGAPPVRGGPSETQAGSVGREQGPSEDPK